MSENSTAAAKPGRFRRSRRRAVTLDERGGDQAGGIRVLDLEGEVLHTASAPVARSMRYLIARVELNDPGGLPERIGVAAALRREGTSFTARSLAAVLAYDSSRSVVLVDTNWRQPPPDGDDKPAPGLAEAVEDNLPMEQIIVPTANSRLSLVRAGCAPLARRAALASSVELQNKLDEMSGTFDHMVVDLPSVLASSEALLLSQLTDALVLVVLQGVTPESQVDAALDELRGSEILGVVLNRYHTRVPRRIRRLIGV